MPLTVKLALMLFLPELASKRDPFAMKYLFQCLTRPICLLLLSFHVMGAETESPQFNTTNNVYYGGEEKYRDDQQLIDIYWQSEQKNLPLIIYVHAGDWAFGDEKDTSSKPAFFLSHGIAVVSMNYRLRWDYKLIDQVEDIVSVVSWVKKNADNYGLDAGRIVLMGHAAGVHLVSLVGTNPNYLKFSGMSLKDLAGVVAIDTASYDINRLMDELGSFIERRQHRLIFGDDEEVWRQSSPIHHIAKGTGIPGFAILYSTQNEQSKRQATAFAKKLIGANIDTIMIPGSGRIGMSISDKLGTADDVPTGALMAFLRAKF